MAKIDEHGSLTEASRLTDEHRQIGSNIVAEVAKDPNVH